MVGAFQRFALLGLCVLAGWTWGCTSPRGSVAAGRISLEEAGDPARRASNRLVVDGLDADAAGATDRARSRYQRAVQIDASNPFAQLALARHCLETGDFALAIAHLDQAELLFESDSASWRSYEAHVTGLRGLAARELDPPNGGDLLLGEARRASPKTWGDAWLSADELR